MSSDDRNVQLYSLLHTYFGYKEFRSEQLNIINDVLDGNDMLVLMPTGAGKSLCFQIPALYDGGLTVVVSPLLSLIYDQIADLTAVGITAHSYSSTSTVTLTDIFSDVHNGICNILYTTPETFNKNSSLQMHLHRLAEEDQLKRFVIDEAHVMTEWGHDFRPEYLDLHMRSLYPEIPIIAFTATATKLVSADIINKLQLEEPLIFCTTFIKDNILYRIREKEQDSWSYIGNSVYKTIISDGCANSSGIIYCLSRKECEYIANFLKLRGMSAEFYHAQIPIEQKERVQSNWRAGKVSVIVATIAFALGINKPNVRYVIHTSMPKSIESYYQQTGRAGRDGLKCKCTMYYSYKDLETLRKMDNIVESCISQDLGFSLGNEILQVQTTVLPPVTNDSRLSDIYNMCCNTVDCIKIQLSNYLGEYSVSSCNGRNKAELCCNCTHKSMMPYQLNVDCEVRWIYSMLPNKRSIICKNYTTYRILNELLNQSYLNIKVKGRDEIVTVNNTQPIGFYINKL